MIDSPKLVMGREYFIKELYDEETRKEELEILEEKRKKLEEKERVQQILDNY